MVDAKARAQSLADQIALAQRTLTAAEETLKLSQQRKEFGVGVVLETLEAGQDYALARQEYLRVLADHNTAQFNLRAAVGQPLTPAEPSRP